MLIFPKVDDSFALNSMCKPFVWRCQIVALLLVGLARTAPVEGFLPIARAPTLSHCSDPVYNVPSSATSLLAKMKLKSDDELGTAIADYNDDAFGLVFLSGSFVARDVIFSAIFVVFSALATIAVRRKLIVGSNRIPALVAGASLGLATLLSMVLSSTSPESLASSGSSITNWLDAKSDTAIQVEAAVCSLSILYGLVVSPLMRK